MRAALAVLALALPPAAPTNYSHATMRASDVRLVVVHVAEGSFLGTVRWFASPRARASTHYVVGRDGEAAHPVPDGHPAWHAGNGWVNAHSIGIEHEGYTRIAGTFTDAEYRASARLVAGLLRRYRLPADRRHVIGHDQVPDPFHPGRFGGWAHHTDPGPHWDWARYLAYVRAYRAGRVPPPPPLDVALPGLALGQTVSGVVPLRPVTVGDVASLELLVDGKPRPSLDWESAAEANGRHVVSVRATGVDGRVALATVVVKTENVPPEPPLVSFEPLQPLPGPVAIQPVISGGPVVRVELWVDGVVVRTATAAPWTLDWEATPGTHTVALRAVGPRGAATAAVQTVTVEPPPAPPPG